MGGWVAAVLDVLVPVLFFMVGGWGIRRIGGQAAATAVVQQLLLPRGSTPAPLTAITDHIRGAVPCCAVVPHVPHISR